MVPTRARHSPAAAPAVALPASPTPTLYCRSHDEAFGTTVTPAEAVPSGGIPLLAGIALAAAFVALALLLPAGVLLPAG